MTGHTPRDGILFIITQNVAWRALLSLTWQVIILAASYSTFAYCQLFEGPQVVGTASALIALCSASMLVATALPMIGFERMYERLRD